MPGKINPVIPEVVNQVAFNIIGNDMTITMAAEAGQLELNAFEPIIFYNLFQSIETLTSAVRTLIDNCIVGITANEKHCREMVDGSIGIITADCPDKLCVHQGFISDSRLPITCLPNRLVIQLRPENQEKIDSITADMITY